MGDVYLGSCAEFSQFYRMELDCCPHCHKGNDFEALDLGDGYFDLCCATYTEARELIEKRGYLWRKK